MSTDNVIDARNIQSTSSPVNSGLNHVKKQSKVKKLVHLNEPSYSSSNYFADMESNQTPPLVYMDSTTRYAKV